MATGKLLRKIDKNKWITRFAFSPDGSHLLGSDYHTSYLWRLADNKRLRTIKQGCCETSGVQWDPSGKMLIYGSRKAVVLRDAMKGESIHTFEYEDDDFAGVAWHPDGQQVAAGNSKGLIRIFTLGENRPVYLCEAHKDKVLCLAYTPDGRFLASGGKDKSVCLWAFDPAYLPATTSSHKKALEVVESTPLNDEAQVSAHSSAWWQQITEIERLSNYVEPRHELDLPHLVCHAKGKVHTVGYVADGKELVGITEEGILYRWRINDGQLIKKERLLARKNQLTCAAISPDGQMVATGDKNFMVHIRRLKDGKLLHQLRGHTQEIKALAYTPDSQVLASSGGKDETIRLWDVADGKLLHTIKAKKETICLKFSPDGQYLACGSQYGVDIWRTRDKRWRRKLRNGCTTEHNMSWSPDGQFLLCAYGSQMYSLRVVDGREMIHFRGHNNSIEAVAWHPNGHSVLSACSDDTLRVWSALAPYMRHVSKGHRRSVCCVAFSPDGRTFASGGEDGAVRLWFLPDNLDESLDHTLNTTFSPDISSMSALETPIQEQPVAAPSTISLTKTAASSEPARESSILRKISRWVTRQLVT